MMWSSAAGKDSSSGSIGSKKPNDIHRNVYISSSVPWWSEKIRRHLRSLCSSLEADGSAFNVCWPRLIVVWWFCLFYSRAINTQFIMLWFTGKYPLEAQKMCHVQCLPATKPLIYLREIVAFGSLLSGYPPHQEIT